MKSLTVILFVFIISVIQSYGQDLTPLIPYLSTNQLIEKDETLRKLQAQMGSEMKDLPPGLKFDLVSEKIEKIKKEFTDYLNKLTIAVNNDTTGKKLNFTVFDKDIFKIDYGIVTGDALWENLNDDLNLAKYINNQELNDEIDTNITKLTTAVFDKLKLKTELRKAILQIACSLLGSSVSTVNNDAESLNKLLAKTIRNEIIDILLNDFSKIDLSNINMKTDFKPGITSQDIISNFILT